MSFIGGKVLRGALLRLGRQGQSIVNDTFKRFAFEARDVIQDDVAKALDYSGPSTRNFISKYRVKYSTSGGRFTAAIYPAGKISESLLARHVERYTQTTRDRADLKLNGKIAFPISALVKRNARGRVRADMLPGALLQRDAQGRTRGFVTKGGVVMRRMARGKVKPAFVLESSTTHPPRIDVHASFARAIATRGVVAFGKALRKAVFGSSR